MTKATPAASLRPFLPADAPMLAAIFRASVEDLTADDYDEDQRTAWASEAEDEDGFGRKLAGLLTLVATIDGAPAGFASLKGIDRIEMVYVYPTIARQGIGTLLIDALEKLSQARDAKRLVVDASDTARVFFERRGYKAHQRNMVPVRGEWLANTTLEKHFDPQASGAPMSVPQPAREYLTLFDTTLRDGAQTTGVDFSLEDKRTVAAMLDDLGLDYIEGGYPGANPLDTKFFERRPKLRAKFAAFGMTKRAGRSVANDPGVAGTLEADADAVVFVAKAWDFQVQVALGATLDENLEGIAASVEAALQRGREALVDCEHFFDGYKANPDYALRCATTAYEAGARWIVLCDTNGGILPHEIARIVREVVTLIPGSHVGIHAHNDTENAVANSLAAVLAGARQIQGTLNGIGERCGNANLVSLIPTLLLKDDFADRFEIGINPDKLAGLTKLSHGFDEILNRAPYRHAPYVGDSAFATKAGIHASAVLKDARTYEHVVPDSVGNRRKVLVSDQAGKSNILAELERLGVQVSGSDPRVMRLLDEVKERESLGYAYEAADASFVLLARRILGEVPHFFDVERFRVNVERRYNSEGQRITVSEAVVKVTVDGASLMSVAEGTGPVHALDLALRKDLGKYQRYISDLELLDYRVRIFQGGSDAVTRVLIECGDGAGQRWSTVGVSANIIDASFQALVDAINYRLLTAGAA